MKWNRLNLCELEDKLWFPAILRDYSTDYLQVVFDKLGPYDVIADQLISALAGSRSTEILDLCSGAGGPWIRLLKKIKGKGLYPKVFLSDLYPHAKSALCGSQVDLSYLSESVDAFALREGLPRIITLFTAFHHFPPEKAQIFMRRVATRKSTVAIFEVTERSFASLAIVLLSPLLVLALTPLIKPFRWKRIFLTYFVPLVPAVVLFDGIMSVLKSYSVKELNAFAEASTLPDFKWVTGRTKAHWLPVSVTYCIGAPSLDV